MPSLDINFLKQLHEDYSNYKCFIETGTYQGGTIFGMEPFFDKLYTVEYHSKLFYLVKTKYTGNKIKFLLGDSSRVFGTLLPTINDKSIFFLDGHYSGSGTGKSAKDCPLIEELTHIKNLFRPEAIIIIDDYRLFAADKRAEGGQDWSMITKDGVLNAMGHRVKEVYHLPSELSVDDRLIIHISGL